MITRAFILTFLLLLNYSSQSISSENEPLRITIHPTIINENVVGSSTTIINNKMIRENSHLSLGSLLSRFSGINFENLYSGVDVKSSVKIRGFGEQASRNVLVLLNGIRISDMTIAGANLSRVPIESVYKIEIIKGGTASVLFGDGATAGAVNIITKNPLYSEDKFKITTSLKSFNTKKQIISATRKNDNIALDATISDLSTDGYRENSEYDNSSLNFNITNFTDINSRLWAELKSSDEQTRLPGSILLTDFYNKPKYTRFPEDFGSEKIKSLKIGNEAVLSNNSKFLSSLRLEKKDQYSSMLNFGIRYKSDTSLNTVHLNSQLINSNLFSNKNLESKFGIDVYNSNYKVDANNWAYVQYINKAEQLIIEPSLIFNIRNQFKKGLNFEVGARSHHYNINVNNMLSSKTKVLSNQEDKYAWSIGTDYNFANDKKVFGHVSRSYRSPRLDEIITVGPSTNINPLKHQFSHDIELGFERKSSNDRFKISAFRSLLKNQIFYNSTSFANENYDPSIHQGVELEYDKEINKKFNFTTNSTFMNSYVSKGTFKGNDTPYVPRIKTNASLNYNINKAANASLTYKYFGKTRSGNDDGNVLEKSKSYHVSDIRLSYKFKNITINSFINNFLDEKYYTNLIKGAAGGYVYPQAGRTFGFEVQADF